MTDGEVQDLYADITVFLQVFSAAHPYLTPSDKIALVELAALWASRAISRHKTIEDSRQ